MPHHLTKPPSVPALTRRQLCTGGAAMIAAASATGVSAEDAAEVDFLFVQTAHGMSYAADANRLTLRGVSPVTLFFSDRPDRIAGNMTTERFIPFWSEGEDSFLSNPPNADLSILEGDSLLQVVVELTNPVLEGDNLHYTVARILSGTMPVLGKNTSLFIDVVGMPRTPVSAAGVRRRTYRRAVIE
ncbi:hypothetical protein [Shimia sp. SDUM112013]|uniref:hypothetical protein n=1 Tax=Shimia sp. SDUM112013 TaxID=3136160 RepID=UPI0032EE9503